MRTIATLAMLAIITTGCVNVESDDYQRQPTTGQELMDLAKAHEKGLLSDEEYKAQRRKILKKDGSY